MATFRNGKLTIEGTQDEVTMVERLLERCRRDPSDFLRRDLKIEFTNPRRRRGDGGPAWAYSFFPSRKIKILPSLSMTNKRYCFLHEVGHFVDADHLKHTQRRRLMELMRPMPRGRAAAAPNRAWVSGPYKPMPAECFAEHFVRMISDVEPVNQGFFERRIERRDIADALSIVRAGEGDDDPEFPDDREPLGDEPVADVPRLRARLAEVLEDLDNAREGRRDARQNVRALMQSLESGTAPATLVDALAERDTITRSLRRILKSVDLEPSPM